MCPEERHKFIPTAIGVVYQNKLDQQRGGYVSQKLNSTDINCPKRKSKKRKKSNSKVNGLCLMMTANTRIFRTVLFQFLTSQVQVRRGSRWEKVAFINTFVPEVGQAEQCLLIAAGAAGFICVRTFWVIDL